MSSSPHEFEAQHVAGFTPRTYVIIFIALIALTIVTVGLSFLNLGPWHLVAGIGIGIVKALLVVLFFMHVLHSSRLTWVVIAAGFLWLAILLGGTLADFLSQTWPV